MISCGMIQIIEKCKIFGTNVLREYHNLKQISKENGIKIEIIYLPPYSPNPNLIEWLWKYSKNVILQFYYEEKEKFKSRIQEFFEEDIKDKLIKLELKTFIGTAFQIISS